MVAKQAKTRAINGYDEGQHTKQFHLNPEYFDVTWDGNTAVLIMKHVEVEPMPGPVFDEDMLSWLRLRGLNVEAVEEATLTCIEEQMVVKLMSERLLGY